MDTKLPSGVYKIESGNPGPKVMITVGIHGNERVGILAMDILRKELKLRKGVLYCVYGNLKAIEKNAREIDKNLNRCFLSNNAGNKYEDERAREIMPIMNICDALLDIHSSNSPETTPFIICDPSVFDLASKLDFKIISYGWDNIEPGATEGYMFNQGKIGLGAECGSVKDPDKNTALALKTMYQFLKYFDMIESNISFNNHEQVYAHVTKLLVKETDDFSYVKEFSDFEELVEGEVYAKDGVKEYRAGKDEFILFPRPSKPIGGEAGVVGTYTAHPQTTT